MNFNIIEMENKLIKGEATQVEEASEKIFNTLRDWSESEYQEEMTFLGIDDSNISWERKKILVILYMLSGVKDKDGWFYIDNANLCEICGVNERTITRTKRDFERLGIIKTKRGCKGYPTRYKFFESKIGRLPKISKKTPESTLSTLSGSDFIPVNVDEIRKSITSSVLGSCIGLVDNVDSKTEDKKLSIEGGVQYKEEEQDKEREKYLKQYGDANVYKEGDTKQYSYQNGDIEQYEDEEQDKEQYEDKEQDIDKDGLVMENTRIEESIIKLIEKVDSIYNSINDDRRVQSEVNIKLLEGIKKLHSSISSSKNSNETVSSITSNNKEVQASVNKEATVTTNCKERDTSSSTSTLDKIMSFQVKSLEEQEQQTRKLQEASNQTSEANTNTRVIDKYMECERQETIKKLECEITKPFISSIVHANSYENLLKIRKDFKNEFNKCYTTHQDVLNKSDVDHLIDKFYEAYDKKEKELKQEPSSNSNGIVQSEENNTKDSEQKPSKDETVEATDVETSPKEEEADNTQFQHNDKTSTDSENCQEKEDSTSEPSTVESNKVQVSETDTPNCEEKSQEELDKEFEKETSTMFLIDDYNKTVQANQVEEVQFPKTEKIVLSSEEQNQFQELVNNQAINAVIKKYTVDRNFEEILTEIRKAVTRGKYQERVVQAYIDYTWNTYTFDCNVQDAMKPIEITNDDTVITTASTQKVDSFEEFIKDKVDNIKKNAEENGSELPFGKNPKSRYQEDDESNCYQSEEEKEAMSSSSSYDESQDAIF